MAQKNTFESIKIESGVLSTYRYISERTGKSLQQIISDTLQACSIMYLAGASAAVASIEGTAPKKNGAK